MNPRLRGYLVCLCLLPLAVQAQWRFELLGASSVALSNPHDVKLSADGRLLYVADVGNDRIAVLDPDTLELVGQFGGDILDGVHDIDVAADGRAYVADTHNGRVAVFTLRDTQADFRSELNERLSGPEGVLAHPNGLLYVAGAWSNNVVAFRGEAVVHELRGLSAPHDLELADDGRIWLADAGNNRILLLNEALEIEHELSGAPYHFDGVRYLDVWPDGTLVAADKYSHSVKFIDADGRLVATLGTGKAGLGAGVFRTPEGVDSAADRLWLSDSGNNRVVVYRVMR